MRALLPCARRVHHAAVVVYLLCLSVVLSCGRLHCDCALSHTGCQAACTWQTTQQAGSCYLTGVVAKIQRQTGFQPEAVFRKYLWFLLRERKFDQGAVDDMVLLKSAFGLSADQARHTSVCLHPWAHSVTFRHRTRLRQAKSRQHLGRVHRSPHTLR